VRTKLVAFAWLWAGLAWAGPFESARQAFETGKYAEAVTALEAMPEAAASAEIQHALGAAWFKRGDLGRAIFHFRHAQRLRPRDADSRFNLEFARKTVKDRLPSSSPWLALPLSEKEGWQSGAWLSLLAGLLGVAWAFGGSLWLKRLAVGSAAVAALALAMAGWLTASGRPFGVVTATEAAVYSGPAETYTHLFSLHPGAEFSSLRTDRDWLQIRLSDGKLGWVKADTAVF
jgi:hypothetical protein